MSSLTSESLADILHSDRGIWDFYFPMPVSDRVCSSEFSEVCLLALKYLDHPFSVEIDVLLLDKYFYDFYFQSPAALCFADCSIHHFH